MAGHGLPKVPKEKEPASNGDRTVSGCGIYREIEVVKVRRSLNIAKQHAV